MKLVVTLMIAMGSLEKCIGKEIVEPKEKASI